MAQTPMKMSMKILMLVVVVSIQSGSYKDAGSGGLGADQAIGDRACGDGRAVGLDGQAHPGGGDHGLVAQKRLRGQGQQDQLDDGEDDDEARDHDGHDGTRANGRARGDGGGDAADRDAAGQRGRPFAAEFEVLAGDEVNEGPVDEVGLDNGGEASEHDGLDQPGGASGLHAKGRARMTMAVLMNHSARLASFSQVVKPGKKLAMTRPATRATM